ncbi:GPR endopeptidase [Effusibacillus dendaii]|uniref:Germination protease n=1 Tax=Effusibacillus dendaii TaxID=2743772 RepID=A0A7I8DI41_9BACL|nr:GPR endopeptidase [Effusibacillus dendaii]BCJ88596.1 germination protease [Effusibacillus dendaii]
MEQTERNEQTERTDAYEGYSVRTDLALEAHQMAGATHGAATIPGVESEEEEADGFRITKMRITDQVAAKMLGKQEGSYLTFEIPGLRQKDPELHQNVAKRFAEELQKFINLPDKASVLIVGLGNWNVTPDALGPSVAKKVFVTRHLYAHMPELLNDGFRPVAAVSPGVLGITGIETSEIVNGIVQHMKPDLVIAIDALASRSLERVNTTIQVADTGINPGSGVGNKRKALNKESLGVPVVAIGVPTVVDAVTIAHDTMQHLMSRLSQIVPGNDCAKLFDNFNDQERRRLIHEVLQPLGQNLMVTPKEIDRFIDDIAAVVANGLNMALHQSITPEDAPMFLQS